MSTIVRYETMAPKVSNHDGGKLAAQLKPFRNSTGTFHGEAVEPGDDPAGFDYVVWSYRTVIAGHHPTNGWWLSSTRYSHSTSKHQGYVRRAVQAAGAA